ncbi:MAG TPA: tetratricopeptide repeat protein [Thermoguttaceae bacterium]|nr:tetratricopeptide repeat protein [Thermoguttaceae bacterium]
MNTKRALLGLLLAVLSVGSMARGDDDPLAKARELLLGGEYLSAEGAYTPLANKKDPVAVLGLARALCAQGERDDAVKVLTAAAEEHAPLQAELARLAFERGDYPEAKARCEAAIKLDRNQLPAIWVRAELDRTAGRLDEAGRGYRDLIRYYNANDVEDAESLRWIGLGAAQYARWNRSSGQFSFLVNDLYPDALKLEPKYWPAHYEAALLFLEKYNKPDAEDELEAALKLNSNAAEVHVAVAVLAVEQRDFEKAEESIEKAIELNPQLLAAWLGKADLAWANFQVQQTLRLLEEKALPLNPVSEETLGRVAACYALLDGRPHAPANPRLARLVEGVTSRNPRAGTFYFTLAAMLEERHRHAEAKPFLLKAIEIMPQLVGPRSHLGLLQMRAGNEPEARKSLDEAFEVDPFNVRVHNTRRVLEVLDAMETRQTEHFTIRYAAEYDELLTRYAARRLEEIYPKRCEQFGYRPPGKPLLEVFNRAEGVAGQEWFSARMTGLPYLGAVAASTGYLVAMSSPNDPGSPQRFNWARVLEHELVHVITLQQTDFNIPHWYTEGLAVWCEGGPRPQNWNELLLKRVPAGELFDLQTLNFGFTRAQSSDEWQLAYCQAELYVEYILAQFGSGRLRKLLAAYGDGLTTVEAIPRALGVSEPTFERGYREHLRKLVAGMTGLKHPSGASFDDLLEAHRQQPEDPDAAAELAYAYLQRDADKEALELAEKVLKEHPRHQLATYVLARLRLKEDKTNEAVALLEGCLDPDVPQPNVLNLLAGLKLKAEQYEDAARLYALGQRLDSVNLQWTKALARVYLEADNQQKLAEVLERLAQADPDDLTSRNKLAQMALKGREYALAADWANQALEIDVLDADPHRMLGEALVGLRRYAEAVEELEIAVELDPKSAQQLYTLADACILAKEPAKARGALKSLLQLEPDFPGVQLMLENLEETEKP